MPMTSKVALVIDALPGLGGAEKVLMAALELFPEAPIYTLIYNQDQFKRTPIEHRQVTTSFIGDLPLARSQYRKYLPLMPLAIQQFDLSRYETILTFSYAVANGVKVCDGQKLLSYTFTPMRYAWRNMNLDGAKGRTSFLLEGIFNQFRQWDRLAASRVNRFAAVSGWISNSIQHAYQRESSVIYPPVEIERFTPSKARDDYYITVARLVPHKRIDLLVEAFNRLKLPLIIIGQGPELEKLERRAADNIQFLGFQSDTIIERLLSRAKAYICPGEEDFGIAIVEAQAAGCPVIAFEAGGAKEIVVENQTGIFFKESTPESLITAVEKLKTLNIDASDCQTNAARFNKNRFLHDLCAFITPL